MVTTTKPRTDWDAIRLDYLHGMPIREIAKKYGIYYTQIVHKAKAKRWGQHNDVGIKIDKLVDNIRDNTEIDNMLDMSAEYRDLQQSFNVTVGSSTDDMLRRMIIKRAILQNKGFEASLKYYSSLELYADKLCKNIEKSPDGMYTKSISNNGSVTYGSYADDLAKVAIPLISETNKALGMATAQVAIQNNVTNGNGKDIQETNISTNIVEASRDYQDFIRQK